jgi:hypothetical protein
MFSSYKDGPYNSDGIRRRTFLIGAGTAAVGFTWASFETHAAAHAEAPSVALPKTVRIVEFTDSGQRTETATLDRVVKTEDEWRNQLSPDSFEITRRAGTRRPCTNENSTPPRKVFFDAFAATRHYLTQAPNSNPARVGRVSGRPLRKRMFWSPRTLASEWLGQRARAHVATRTWDTFSMMDRPRRVCVTA